MRSLHWIALGLVQALLLFVETTAVQNRAEGSFDEDAMPTTRSLRQKKGTEQVASHLCGKQSPKQIFTCKRYFKHSTDRLANSSPLYAGEAACHNEFMFGVTQEGVFQWADCAKNKTKVFYSDGSNDVYFELQSDASWNIYEKSTGKLKWKEECDLDVHLYPQCLSHVNLDCPYIHLRKSGRIVLNSIDNSGMWVASNSPRVYSFIDEED